jgi:hypothetical protein
MLWLYGMHIRECNYIAQVQSIYIEIFELN